MNTVLGSNHTCPMLPEGVSTMYHHCYGDTLAWNKTFTEELFTIRTPTHALHVGGVCNNDKRTNCTCRSPSAGMKVALQPACAARMHALACKQGAMPPCRRVAAAHGAGRAFKPCTTSGTPASKRAVRTHAKELVLDAPVIADALVSGATGAEMIMWQVRPGCTTGVIPSPHCRGAHTERLGMMWLEIHLVAAACAVGRTLHSITQMLDTLLPAPWALQREPYPATASAHPYPSSC